MKKWLIRIGYTLLVLFVLLNVVAAFHAYKFTHFYNTAPEKKRPEDMGFSDKAAAILFGIKYPKSKTVDSLKSMHDTVYIKTQDSIKLEAWWLYPPPMPVFPWKGTVIMFHGHGGSKSGMIKEAEAFYNKQYNVLMVDFRAHGNSEGNTCTIGYNEAKDVKAAYDFAKKQIDQPVILWGVSLGAVAITKAVSDYNLKPDKVILEMPYATLIDAVKARLTIMGLPHQPFATLLTFWGGIEHGFWAFNLKPAEYVKKLQCPVLLQWGAKDNRVSKQETDIIYTNITMTKQLVIYNNAGHESLVKNDSILWNKSVSLFLNK